MEDLQNTLDQTIEFLWPLLPLANSHTVDFIVGDVWRKLVPKKIRFEVKQYGACQVIDVLWRRGENNLSEFCQRGESYVIEKTCYFKEVEKLRSEWDSNFTNPVLINEFMNNKKIHEVVKTSSVIADLAQVTNANLVIDIGSGKGYLTSILALHHQLRVLGIDCKASNIIGAIRTTNKLEKKWKKVDLGERKDEKLKSKIIKEHCASNKEYYEKYKWRSAIVGNSFKQRVENISNETNMKAVIEEEYPEEKNPRVLLVGLHTCGNLAADCLRLFIKNQDRIKSVLSIGCCYNLIDEKFALGVRCQHSKSDGQRPLQPGFPMSSYLTKRQFYLGRDARMNGTQNPEKIFKNKEITTATKPLFYRALLQKLFTELLGPEKLPTGVVGRIAHKCKTFQEYVFKAFRKLKIKLEMTEAEISEFAELHSMYWNHLKVFFLLKTSLSPVIETVILLDRLLYLYEQGNCSSYVTKLFDPVISPRCYAIVSTTCV